MKKILIFILLSFSHSIVSYAKSGVESNCKKPSESESILYSNEFHWNSSLEEIGKMFTNVYDSGKRLKSRAFYDEESKNYVFEILVDNPSRKKNSDSFQITKLVKIDPRFISSITCLRLSFTPTKNPGKSGMSKTSSSSPPCNRPTARGLAAWVTRSTPLVPYFHSLSIIASCRSTKNNQPLLSCAHSSSAAASSLRAVSPHSLWRNPPTCCASLTAINFMVHSLASLKIMISHGNVTMSVRQ